MNKPAKDSSPEKAHLVRKHPNLLALAFLLLAVSFLGLLISYKSGYLFPKSSEQASSTTNKYKNTQKTNGSIYGFWATVIKIEKQGEGGPKENPEYSGGVISVKATDGKKYDLQLEYQRVKEVNSPEGDVGAIWYKKLEVGQKIYVDTYTDVKNKNVLGFSDIKAIEVQVKEKE